MWQTRGGTFKPLIYSNYIHGFLGSGSATGFIYCTYGSGSSGNAISCDIFNNLLVDVGGFSTPIWIGGANVNSSILNNTLILQTHSSSAAIQIYSTGAGANISIENNIIWDGRLAYQTTDGLYAQLGTVANNLYYMINSVNDPTGNSWRGYGIAVNFATCQSEGLRDKQHYEFKSFVKCKLYPATRLSRHRRRHQSNKSRHYGS